MRRLISYALIVVIVAFYGGVATAAATPLYGAITGFVHNATNLTPQAQTTAPASGKTATALPQATPVGTSTSTSTAVPSATQRPHPTSPAKAATPTQRQLAAMVQHLANHNKLPSRRINFLIMGSDNDQKFASYAHPLTQVMIVLSIDPVSNTITMLSIPRDFWVHIPGYKYNTGPDGTVGWSKIDVAAKLGFSSAACTVEKDFGIPIDHWVWVGLNGFTQVINSMHGVTLDVQHPVIDDTYPDDINSNDPYGYRRIYIPPGPQHLQGDAALHFVRSRHGDSQGDFGRSARQQILLTQLRQDLLKQDSAALVALAPQLLQDMKDNIKTDLSPDLSTMAYYWDLFHKIQHAKMRQVVLSPPVYSSMVTEYDSDPQVEAETGQYPTQESAVAPNWTAIDVEIQKLFGGQSSYAPHCGGIAGAGQ